MISAGVPAGTAARSPQNRAPLWTHAQGNYCAYLQELQVIGKASLEYPSNHLEICFQRSRRFDGLQDRNHITSSRADILQSANELFYGRALRTREKWNQEPSRSWLFQISRIDGKGLIGFVW
jgi:hypothetical protein